ncbi:MAG: hypothetical protein ACE5JS_19785 [Nitrospinota bacterium]
MIEPRVRRPKVRWIPPALAVVAAALILALASCTKDPLKRAFRGKFLTSENNRIISNYCQSCHVHREFVPEVHMAAVKRRYTVRKLREAEECRDCHSVDFKLFSPEDRRTLHPPDGRSG